MGCDFIALATPGVKGLTPYQPGKPVEELERELGIDNIIKLASNENPLGPSALVLAAIEKAAKELTRYPDGGSESYAVICESVLWVVVGAYLFRT